MPHPLTREYCLGKADECQREADRAGSDGDRRIYGRLAEYWQAMARAVPLQAPPYPSSAPSNKYRQH